VAEARKRVAPNAPIPVATPPVSSATSAMAINSSTSVTPRAEPARLARELQDAFKRAARSRDTAVEDKPTASFLVVVARSGHLDVVLGSLLWFRSARPSVDPAIAALDLNRLTPRVVRSTSLVDHTGPRE